MNASGKTIRVAVVGGSGYAGYEVLRWLARHPHVEVVGVFGPENEVGPMDEFFPMLTRQCRLRQEIFTERAVAALKADLAMLCVPHKVAMSYVPVLRRIGLRVIDWSADYRLADAAEYEKWYCPHTDPAGLAEAVYGLPEYFGSRIAEADLVANPGCYPTCAVLPLAPALKDGLIMPDDIVVNAVSGISGAGRTPSLKQHFPERNENFEPYGVGNHRHMPEMEQALTAITGKKTALLFQPHLCPMDRGMLCTIFARPASSAVTPGDLQKSLETAYRDAPFVRVRTEILPATKYVAHTNYCDVAVRQAKGRIVLFSAIDNLLKGASTQAIQNMNLMF
ncbi:MAG TPA: N-acetyl-gamma-glutamyl-phosphate reductase, partial [Acidobacteriota bacterium]|nr:N-acetyl-gamma-glutamyl-phosphate reductase [Acidobacteriota bacterium]